MDLKFKKDIYAGSARRPVIKGPRSGVPRQAPSVKSATGTSIAHLGELNLTSCQSPLLGKGKPFSGTAWTCTLCNRCFETKRGLGVHSFHCKKKNIGVPGSGLGPSSSAITSHKGLKIKNKIMTKNTTSSTAKRKTVLTAKSKITCKGMVTNTSKACQSSFSCNSESAKNCTRILTTACNNDDGKLKVFDFRSDSDNDTPHSYSSPATTSCTTPAHRTHAFSTTGHSTRPTSPISVQFMGLSEPSSLKNAPVVSQATPSHSQVDRLMSVAVSTSRKNVEWFEVQEKCFPDAPHSSDVNIKDKLSLPVKDEEWERIDKIVTSKLHDQEDLIPDALFKDIIYESFADEFGTRSTTIRCTKTHIVSEKKKVRRLKKAAKKEFKLLQRTGADDDSLKRNGIERQRLVRLHNKLRCQEEAVIKVQEQIRNNTNFSKDPFKFVKEHVTKSSSKHISPSCSLLEAEKFFKKRYDDPSREEYIAFPEFLPLPGPPAKKLNCESPSVEEIELYLKSRRNKSSAGPDGIPYVIFKKCKGIRGYLIAIVKRIWAERKFSDCDRLASKYLLPKSGSSKIDDFRDLTLFNTTLKVVTGIWGRRVVKFMTSNSYIDTTVQKGFVPRIAGCVEHNQTLSDLLKEHKKDHKEFQVAFLDLENAFGSVKHNLLFAALKWYGIPSEMIDIIKDLYSNVSVSVITKNWTTSPIKILIGALQGGPEAGLLFNVAWNLIITALVLAMKNMGYVASNKPVSGFADDLTLKTGKVCDMAEILKIAEHCIAWTQCMKFKSSKSVILAVDCEGKPFDPRLTLNDTLIPSLINKPFKFLGKWLYPSLNDKNSKADALTKVQNLLSKVDNIVLDGKKKAWIFQFGIIPYVQWDFMQTELDESTVSKMESAVNRFLKKWLNLARCADPSILYRGVCGLRIDNIRNIVLAARANTEVTLCTSKDPVVRAVAKRRREVEQCLDGYSTPKKIKTAVQEIEFKKAFYHNIRKGNDRRGLSVEKKVKLTKKTLVEEVKKLSNDEKITRVMSLAVQGRWTKWEDLVQVDLDWKEVLYGFSPSMLSFWLNSIQDTLPDPVNLRRWGKAFEAKCGLCGWSNCSQIHILCSCRIALEQGRISWRHDSILNVIVKWMKIGKVQATKSFKKSDQLATDKILFVKAGAPRAKKRVLPSFWHDGSDWIFLMDSRSAPYQIPPQIVSSSLRPDICVYSLSRKKVCFVELTSPFEENIRLWKAKKQLKYAGLVDDAKSNGWEASCLTIEVGARGFVSLNTHSLFRFFGLTPKDSKTARKEISKVAIKCSHFIWISRCNPLWSHPARVC